MGSDNASDAGFAKVFSFSFPDKAAVFLIFFKHIRIVAGVTKKKRHCKINTAGFFNFFDKEVVALFGTACFAKNVDFAVFNAYNGFDVKKASGKSCGFAGS